MKHGRPFAAVAALTVLPPACWADPVSMGYDSPVENRGTMPFGEVWSCYGGPCPHGECDNDRILSDELCEDVYPAPVDDGAVFCQPGREGDYCLLVGSDGFNVDYWLVKCSGTVSTAMQCGRGCQDYNGESTCI